MVIELTGTDSYKFAELRSLGLINEQIDWKQRFFVPTDEEPGLAVLSDLLSRYPELAGDVSADDEPPISEIKPQEFSPTKIVNLDDWFVPVAEVEPIAEAESSPSDEAQRIERAEATLTLPAFYFVLPHNLAKTLRKQLALDVG